MSMTRITALVSTCSVLLSDDSWMNLMLCMLPWRYVTMTTAWQAERVRTNQWLYWCTCSKQRSGDTEMKQVFHMMMDIGLNPTSINDGLCSPNYE